MHSRVDLSTLTASAPVGLPAALVGLSDESLADLPAALDPVPEEFDGVGYWPVDYAPVQYDPRLQTQTGEVTTTADPETGRVVAVPVLRDLTEDEIAALPPLPVPQPRVLGKLEFIGLVQLAGGMTDAQLTTAYKDPQLEAFWVKYQMASQVLRDHAVTTEALGALDALGYIPNGAQAVLDAWPMQ